MLDDGVAVAQVSNMADDPVIDWLLDGDPAIRWQVMRDLLDQPGEVWEAERRRTVSSGRTTAHRTPITVCL